MTTYDAIVIGIGTMGAAACDSLARRGQRILGLEQFDIPHALGSHHGESRMFRLAYYEHADYIPLLRRALDLWRDLEQRAGLDLLHLTGGIYLSPPNGTMVPLSAQSAAAHGLEHELLSIPALRERFPQFRIPDDWQAMLEPTAGFVLPELAISAMARLALHAGAAIHPREPVLSWQRSGGGADLEVRTARETYRARRLIICGGAWSSRLIQGLSIPLTVTRQVLGWVAPSDPEPFALRRFPCWAAELPDASLHYGFPILPPELSGTRGLKIAHHRKGHPADPDHLSRAITPADEAEFRAALTHLHHADGPTVAAAACMYTNSPDSHFIIDRHPVDPDVVFACGFSGHGFKFAPVIGEILADLAIDGRTNLPAAFLNLARFR